MISDGGGRKKKQASMLFATGTFALDRLFGRSNPILATQGTLACQQHGGRGYDLILWCAASNLACRIILGYRG
jgi:hypothetical protein